MYLGFVCIFFRIAYCSSTEILLITTFLGFFLIFLVSLVIYVFYVNACSFSMIFVETLLCYYVGAFTSFNSNYKLILLELFIDGDLLINTGGSLGIALIGDVTAPPVLHY